MDGRRGGGRTRGTENMQPAKIFGGFREGGFGILGAGTKGGTTMRSLHGRHLGGGFFRPSKRKIIWRGRRGHLPEDGHTQQGYEKLFRSSRE